MRHRDGDDSDGDTRSTVRFTSERQEPSSLRERVLDTEDAARGPLSGIFRLTDSPRVMKKLQECERAGKRKKEEQPASQQTAVQQPQPPKPQVRTSRFRKIRKELTFRGRQAWILRAPAPQFRLRLRVSIANLPISVKLEAQFRLGIVDHLDYLTLCRTI